MINENQYEGCPFCGNKFIILRISKETPNNKIKYYTQCRNCKAKSRKTFSKKKAIELWNTRVIKKENKNGAN